MNPKAYRLPRHTRPRQYDLRFNMRLDSPTFTGSATIQLDITQEAESVELHARDLQIATARLTHPTAMLDGQVTLDPDREIAAITFGEPIPAGAATLDLTFSGNVGNGLAGLYVAQDGPERLLCTQSFATEARTIFPCFDEPDFKARFSYEITTDAAHTVLTNSPLLGFRPPRGHPDFGLRIDGDAKSENQQSQNEIRNPKSEIRNSRTWTFAPTKPMSSYLVAFVIGDIASTSEEAVNGVPIRVWALKGKEQMGQFAHAYTTRLLPWYEDYFAVPYHFDKYDQVAVPGFAAGAMENAGLVTFRQHLLLMNPQTASWKQEKLIALVVAHEFAHMWFGNLATIKWWDDTWLSEAFAEWLGHKVVSLLSPDYGIWDDFQDLKNRALAADALESTHPIYTPVQTPAEAMEMFDAISYMKGCSVLRMLESYLGEQPFRDGLRSYIAEFAESNAAGPDLWRNLQTASSQPVTSIMESWVLHPGYPSLKVALEGIGDGATALRVSQSRFYSSPTGGATNSVETHIWQVPMIIRYTDSTGTHGFRYLLTEQSATVTLPTNGDLRWCYANADEVGFYRQDQDSGLLDKLLANLDKLSPLEQMGLLGDQWALTYNGTLGIAQFLQVLSAIASTGNHNVLEQVVLRLHDLEDYLVDTGDEVALTNFRRWVRSLFAGRMLALGYEPRQGESRNEAQQRVSVVDALATIAVDREAQAQAIIWADREAEDPASVDPNLANVYIHAAAQAGDEARFNRYVDIYLRRRQAGASPQETNRYLTALIRFLLPDLVARTLQLMDDRVIPQESINPGLGAMMARRHSQLAAWAYLKSHWAEAIERGGMGFGNLVESTGQLPASLRQDLVAFMDANLRDLAPMSYARALEIMDQRAEFKSRTRQDLLAWFSRAA